MKKQNILNWTVAALLLIALIVCYFFWGCSLDFIVTIIALVVVVAGSTLLSMQNKKIKELTGSEE